MANDSETKVKSENSAQLNPEKNHKKSDNSENNQPNLIVKIKTLITSWQFKLIAILTLIISILLVIFFWKHIVATQGLRGWARHAKAQPIDCMMQDTNDDQYISCTAKLGQQIVPLECGTDVFNMGCRVNYGNALPAKK